MTETKLIRLRNILNHCPIGAAVESYHVDNYNEILKQHFSSLTAENHHKFGELQREEGVYDFRRADHLVNFARENNMSFRGHALIWHHPLVCPEWLFVDIDGNPASRELLLARMKRHINTVLGRYRGFIPVWDVVNEAIADTGTREMIWKKAHLTHVELSFEQEAQKNLRKTPWLELIGEDYLLQAFRFAHEADPDVLLFYNDYNAEQPVKRDKILIMLKDLQEQGAPVHGMGIQGHFNIYDYNETELVEAIEAYASLGLQVHLTEVDFSFYNWDTNQQAEKLIVSKEDQERYEAALYSLLKIVHTYRKEVTSLTFWGVSDKDSWLQSFPKGMRKNYPLIFDANVQLKPAVIRCLNKVINEL